MLEICAYVNVKILLVIIIIIIIYIYIHIIFMYLNAILCCFCMFGFFSIGMICDSQSFTMI